MSIFTHSIPVLPVKSIPSSMDFYDKLGFRRVWEDFDYGILERDAVEIHLVKCSDPRIAENSTCRLLVTGIEELFTLYQMMNLIPPGSYIEKEPWGSRAFGVLDPDGNLLKFIEKSIPKPVSLRKIPRQSDEKDLNHLR
jgi:catechol 2,3-dioxygenase-like lactoylglutathione lyase family enzyme